MCRYAINRVSLDYHLSMVTMSLKCYYILEMHFCYRFASLKTWYTIYIIVRTTIKLVKHYILVLFNASDLMRACAYYIARATLKVVFHIDDLLHSFTRMRLWEWEKVYLLQVYFSKMSLFDDDVGNFRSYLAIYLKIWLIKGIMIFIQKLSSSLLKHIWSSIP